MSNEKRDNAILQTIAQNSSLTEAERNNFSQAQFGSSFGNNKRDKLAKEYVDSGMLNSNHPHEFYSFCDGYDQGYSACASEKDEHLAQTTSNLELWREKSFELSKERDELKAEIEEWKIHLDLEIKDCDQWREQAEALYAVLEHAHAVGYIGDRGSTAKWCKEVLAAFEAFKKGLK